VDCLGLIGGVPSCPSMRLQRSNLDPTVTNHSLVIDQLGRRYPTVILRAETDGNKQLGYFVSSDFSFVAKGFRDPYS